MANATGRRPAGSPLGSPVFSTDPTMDTAMSAPAWRVVFCRPEPSPDWRAGVVDISSEVSAENAIVLAAPVSSRPVIATGYAVRGPTVASVAVPSRQQANPAASMAAWP